MHDLAFAPHLGFNHQYMDERRIMMQCWADSRNRF
jgi:hypothetical protein